MVTSAAPATIHYSCSTSSAIWSGVPFAPAMSTVPTVGVRFWNRSLSVIGNGNLHRYFRGDAAFAAPDIYEFLESEGFSLRESGCRRTKILQERHCPPADPPRRSSAEPCAALLRQLQVSGWKLGQEAARGGQGGMAPRRVVPPRRLYCHQPVRGPPNGWWRFIITVGQRGGVARLVENWRTGVNS